MEKPHLKQLLEEMIKRKSSDLHIKVDRPPLMRISGELLPTEFPPYSEEEVKEILYEIMTEEQLKRFKEDLELDFSYSIKGKARFRINVFMQRGMPGAAIRMIPEKVPTIDELGLPPVLKDITSYKQGLILVTGPTGSGKSTTLAAMINHINETRPVHIITIEDPIEFVYTDKKATINQRELGQDTKDFKEALRRALRQDPDVILMGEMRDAQTIEFAIHAAETGHLVFSTLHTNDAKQTIDRILDSFPTENTRQIRVMLALTLRAIISQRLVKRADGDGRVAALEIMINSPNISELIEAGKTREIEKVIEASGDYYRMQSFNQALGELVRKNIITEEEALSTSPRPDDLKLILRGIQKGGDFSLSSSKTSKKDASKININIPLKEDEEDEKKESRLKITRGFEF